MSDTASDGGLGGSPDALAGLLLSEETVAGLLELIVDLAASTIGGVAAASISQVVGADRSLETTGASSAAARAADDAQYRDREGPCVEAIRTGSEVVIVLPTDRWPHFSNRAQEAGMRSVRSLPLRVRERTTGALNLYSTTDEPVDGLQADAARALARQAAVVLANASALSSAELTNQHLEDALVSRDLIGQAKGILMARQGISADEAFDLLRRLSQRTGRKLREVAAEIADNPVA